MKLLIQRIYGPQDTNGYRVLVDRLWPQGVSKVKAALDLWAKDIAPSKELRVWYHANRNQFEKFKTDYTKELNNNPDVPAFIKSLQDHKTVILLTASKDVDHCEVPILKEYIENYLKQ